MSSDPERSATGSDPDTLVPADGPGRRSDGAGRATEPPAPAGVATDDAARGSAAADAGSSGPADGSPGPEGGTRRERRRRSTRAAVIGWVITIAAALLIAFVIKTWFLQAYYIPSPSMVPTLDVHDRVLVNKLAYHFHDPHRGDIVVFTAPPGVETSDIKDLVKRIIGLPGDTIEGRNGHVYIDGRLLKEPYLPHGLQSKTFGPYHVPKSDYYVLGDNRPLSKDSTVFGPIKRSMIVGRAFVRIWPLNRLSFL